MDYSERVAVNFVKRPHLGSRQTPELAMVLMYSELAGPQLKTQYRAGLGARQPEHSPPVVI